MAAEAVRELKKSLNDDEGFFDRHEEMTDLLTQIEGGFNRIAVVIGPNNSGKSALLKQLRKMWDTSPLLKAQLPLFYMDMDMDFSSPEQAAAQIARQMQTWASWLKDVAAALLKTIGGVSVDLKKLTFKGVNLDASSFLELLKAEPVKDLGSVMSWFMSLAAENQHRRPIFVIDEAHRLKRWSDQDVGTLLGCFIAMPKQDRTGMLILSTSDDLFRQWFQSHTNVQQWKPVEWKPVGVGHFGEKNAKAFLSSLVAKRIAAGATAPHSWSEQRVYEICGGCPLTLENCVIDVFEQGRSMEVVLEDKVVAQLPKILLGLEHGHGWEEAKFREVMKLIVAHGAVGLSKICRRIFKSDLSECQRQINAMLSFNVIHVRYMPRGLVYDDLRDFDRGPGMNCDFVMARSPTHHVAMKMFCDGAFDEPE